jgi:hypothetical protein
MRGIIFLPIFLAVLIAPVFALDGWSYYSEVTITNNVARDLTDYQINFTLDTATLIAQGKMKSDCGDIRVTLNDGQTLLPYWIETACNNNTTKIWTKVPSIPASGSTTILVWYGNLSATSQSNADSVFILWDNFETGSINTSKWDIKQSYGSVGIKTDVKYEGNYAIGSDQGAGQGGGVSVYDQNHYFGKIPLSQIPVGSKIIWSDYTRRWKVTTYWGHFAGYGIGGTDELYDIPYDNVWHRYDVIIERVNDTGWNFTIYRDGTYQTTISKNKSFTDYLLFGIQTRHNGASDNSIYVRTDNVIVKKYVSPEPSVSVSNEVILRLQISDAVRVKVQYLDTGAISYYSIPIVIDLRQDQTYNVSASLDISGVNPSYGANITVELLSKVTLTNMSYNGSSVSYTYLGQNASNSRVYNVYNFTTTANGTLIVNGTYANRAWNAIVKIDRKVEPIPVLTAVLGESVEIALPARANVTLPNATVLVNVTSLSFNTRTFGAGNKSFTFEIKAIESDDYGLLRIYINTVYASRNVTVLDKDGRSTNNVSIITYNIDANKVTPANAIEAGNNSIQIFFRDIKLAETPAFYVNHTNISDSFTVSVLSKLLPTDYKNANKRIYAQKDFNITVLDAKVSKFAINLTEPSYIYIDFARNFSRPQLILSNCSLISYTFPYAKLYCSGNATVVEGYTITLQVKDALGRAIDVAFTIDNELRSSSGGIVTIIKPVGNYSLILPVESVGFKLKTNATYNITLENDTSITAVYKVPARIESREVRVEENLPLSLLFIPFKTQEVSNVARVKLEGSVMDYFGAPVPNRNVIIEIKAVGGAVRYANTTTDSSGNFRTQTDFTTNTTYTVTYILPEDDTYAGTSSVKTLTYEAIAPPPAPSPIGITIPTTVIVAIVALVVIIAVATVAKSVRKKTVKHTLEDLNDFEFFRKLQ